MVTEFKNTTQRFNKSFFRVLLELYAMMVGGSSLLSVLTLWGLFLFFNIDPLDVIKGNKVLCIFIAFNILAFAIEAYFINRETE